VISHQIEIVQPCDTRLIVNNITILWCFVRVSIIHVLPRIKIFMEKPCGAFSLVAFLYIFMHNYNANRFFLVIKTMMMCILFNYILLLTLDRTLFMMVFKALDPCSYYDGLFNLSMILMINQISPEFSCAFPPTFTKLEIKYYNLVRLLKVVCWLRHAIIFIFFYKLFCTVELSENKLFKMILNLIHYLLDHPLWDRVVSRGKTNVGDAVLVSTIHFIILLYKLLFIIEIEGHDCTGGKIDRRRYPLIRYGPT
jgi:hypothetical protein